MCKTHLRFPLALQLEQHRGEAGPCICADNDPGPVKWPVWNEMIAAAFYGKMLDAVELKDYLEKATYM